jgi:glutathionyl-hydroquinone reductase
MGVLIDGRWTDGVLRQETSQSGAFERTDSVFRGRITADGSSGFMAEPGRYHLYVAHGCPPQRVAQRVASHRSSRSDRKYALAQQTGKMRRVMHDYG